MFLNEVNENLDRASVATFKEALKKFKMGPSSDVDTFTDEVRHIISHLFFPGPKSLLPNFTQGGIE